MSVSFPGESAEYRAARDELLQREIQLRREIEAVAAQRRALPPGGVVPDDYVFDGVGVDGYATEVKLSQLLTPTRDTVAIYSYMFGPEREQPCPACTSVLDGLDGAATHRAARQPGGRCEVAACRAAQDLDPNHVPWSRPPAHLY